MDDDALLEAALLESAALHREEAMLAAAIAESQECMNLNRTAPPELPSVPATPPTTLSPPSVRRNTRNAPAAVLDSSAGRTIRPAASNPARQRRLQQRGQQREQQCRLAPTAAPPESSGAPPKPPERAPRPRLTAPLHGQEHPSWRLPELLPPVARATPPPSAAPPVIVWLRAGDMRLTDNPALHAAAESGNPVIPVFIQPPRCEEGGWPLAGAAAYWLHHSLVALQHSLSRLGSAVVVRRAADCGGSSAAALAALAAESGSRRVYYNASFEPWVVRRDEALEQELASQGVRAKRCAGNVLYHPEDARPDERTAAHGFGSVGFFLAAVATLPPPPPPLPPPRRLKPPAAWPHSLPLSELGYGRLPVRPDGTVEDWAAGIRRSWAVGEIGAQRALEAFVSGGIQRFEGRERFRADQANTAAISPHLRFGELSARAVLHSVRERASAPTFLRRLAWRDLAYWALWRFPHLPSRPFRPWFEAQAWSSDQPALEAWQAGATGFPLVDAAMAQLWATGWMPNYMRHVVAGFLVEFLNLDWRRVLPCPPLPHRRVCVWRSSACLYPGTASAGSTTRSSTQTRPSTPTCGRTGATRAWTSGTLSCTPSLRQSRATRRATTCAGGCRSWPRCRSSTSTARGRRRSPCARLPASCSAATTRSGFSTT